MEDYYLSLYQDSSVYLKDVERLKLNIILFVNKHIH